METKGNRKSGKAASTAASKIIKTDLPLVQANQNCDFHGYDADILMKETAKLRKIITKRGTLEILIPLCCTTTSVRYIKFRNTMKGFSSKTLAKRLKELDETGILERQAYNEIPPRVEYRLTNKGQELVESIIHLLNWMKKWAED
ncbi:MAG TPA: helix-turn-helix domain-containing protein [Nitrososphaeraceae archaeon]|jgi:DNA-binding HxlR family transcriptional regulator